MNPQDSHALKTLGANAVWHPYTKFSALRQNDLPIITRGEGIYLYDSEGHKYVDAVSSWWACALGHSHPEMIDAIQTQTAILQHSILGNLSHPNAIRLAAKLEQLTGGNRHILFASDGASAVEAAMRCTVQYWHNIGRPKKSTFASLRLAYHGDTLGAMNLGFLESFHQPYQALRFPFLQLPDLDRHDQLTAFFEQHARALAGVAVEPLCQGAAGMLLYKPEDLAFLSGLCRTHDVLLIVDEIATGFGRTGTWFAYQQAHIEPDLICMGKALSAGYLPISAVSVKNEIYATFDDEPTDHTFYHGHTFAGNPIAAAAGLKAIEIYERDNLIEHAAELGKRQACIMKPWTDQYGIKQIRTLGLIGVVEFQDKVKNATGTQFASLVQQEMRKRGIFIRPLGAVIYLMMPLITSIQELEDTTQELEKGMRAVFDNL